MYKIIFLFSIAFLISSMLWAQKEDDFFLTMRGDTLYGKIRLDSKSNTIIFWYQGDKLTFHASTIESFGIYKKGKYRTFKTIQNDEKKEVFVEVLTEGTLNLYRYDTTGDKRYNKEDNFRYFICEDDTVIMRVTPRSYKRVLKICLKDKPHLLARRIEYQDIPKIVEAYNDLTYLTGQ